MSETKLVSHGWVCDSCQVDNQVDLDETARITYVTCSKCGGQSALVEAGQAFPKWELLALKPTLRRFSQKVINGVRGTRKYEAWDEGERRTRFTVAVSHVGLVKLLLEKGGSFSFPLPIEDFDALCKREVGIHAGTDGARLWLIDEPTPGGSVASESKT